MNFKLILVIIIFTVAMFFNVYSQIRINEVCSSNDGYYFTHNHEDPDWVELYNYTEDTVNLSGWKIYDRDNYGKAFIFPDTSLAPKSFLIVNCSDKNGFGEEQQVLESSAPAFRLLNYDALDYYYLPMEGDVSLSCSFHNIDFYEPQSQVGIVFRSGLESYDTYSSLVLKKIYEVMPAMHLRYNKHAWISHHQTKVKPNFPINKFRFERKKDSVYFFWQNEKYEWLLEWQLFFESSDEIYAGIAIASNNPEHTTTAAISDIEINGEKYDLADLNYMNINHNNPAKLFISREIHSNFKISNNETIYLWDNEGNLVDEVGFGVLQTNTTFGRYPDGSESMGVMPKPSPGRDNNHIYIGFAEEPKLNIKPGIYNSPQEIIILNDRDSIDIYYTIDGTEPSDTLDKYTGEIIELTASAVLKVKVHRDSFLSGNTYYYNYIINEQTELPVIAISSDPENFFSKDHGIFHERNIQRNIEIPAHFHYFDTKQNKEYKTYMGIKVHGSTSKLTVPMKSMRMYARNRYGENYFNYPFFNNDYSEYKRLVLRNAGQDFHYSYLRDSFVNLLARSIDKNLATSFQPCIVYLNGEYWGLMMLQERVDEKMISSQYRINDNNINLFEDDDMVKNGQYDSLLALIDTLDMLDISNDADVEFLMSKIDIENYINYTAVRFFSLIIDWPCSNQKFWQSDDFDKSYRWIVYDSDISCAFSGQKHNFGNFFPPLCFYAQLFDILIRHKETRTKIINKYCDLLNTTFDKKNTLTMLDSLVDLISPEIPRHSNKWEGSCKDWEEHINKIRDFLEERPKKAWESMLGNLFVYDTASVRFVENEHGKYKINSIIVEDHDKEYYYFSDLPVKISAIPNKGYHFKSWKSSLMPDSKTVSIKLPNSLYYIEAEFISEHEIEYPVINEIMYKYFETGTSVDWIELYNPNNITIYTNDWTLQDKNENHVFRFPEACLIEPKGYLVISNDSTGFVHQYPNVFNQTGYFDFGLGTDDIVRLYSDSEVLMDSVNYSNVLPWDNNADGTGYSLELMEEHLNNSIPENWKASKIDSGTPGRENSWGYINFKEIESGIFKIYPNPAKNHIIVEHPASTMIEIQIYDMFGRELISKELFVRKEIDISSLASGCYILKITLNDHYEFHKIIKKEYNR